MHLVGQTARELARFTTTGDVSVREVVQAHLDHIEERNHELNAIVAMHERLAAATGGRPWVPPHWAILKDLGTPHPLGGCNIGNTAADGVVDHRGDEDALVGLISLFDLVALLA